MRAREPMAVVLLACHRDTAADRLTVVAVAADEVEGLRALAEWTAACWSAPDVNDQPEDEDLLDIYDRCSIGGLPSGDLPFL
ncbi:hypothetical protein ACFV5G_17900 [Streptomyces sp. NPDC059766]|uniref:hypothetical protein n=1 Tax=Streptomyces sp. NPDC059766 TaxID=3346940 RepID=UPI00365C18FC